ncbi:MAG: hydroxymethylbilane synthase [Coriobacteriia bacterium]|nr:hydroxymethylbilane synthase [Coriobacteriia bacterium]MCL2537373.1 hydroxymethylbilane synthase [Coriobacteriia bacterium]
MTLPTTDRTKLVIGTRGSQLALWQANYIKSLIEERCDLPVEIKTIKTTGDKILDVPLAKVGGKGLFTKELEVELLAGDVDLCVHSMKDVPTDLPETLIIAGIPPREDARDVMISATGLGFRELPEGARVGTSSLRRIAHIRSQRPDIEIVDVRGNLDTRMHKAESGELDAVILAAAGIRRLGWGDRITTYLSTDIMISAVGQGAVGVEIREDDEFMLALCDAITDPVTMACVTAERVVMNRLQGGCQVPIGAYCRYEEGSDDLLRLDAMVGSVDGSTILRVSQTGCHEDPTALGEAVVAELTEMGAEDVLSAVREAHTAADLLA